DDLALDAPPVLEQQHVGRGARGEGDEDERAQDDARGGEHPPDPNAEPAPGDPDRYSNRRTVGRSSRGRPDSTKSASGTPRRLDNAPEAPCPREPSRSCSSSPSPRRPPLRGMFPGTRATSGR